MNSQKEKNTKESIKLNVMNFRKNSQKSMEKVKMVEISNNAKKFLEEGRVLRIATVDNNGRPCLAPFCYWIQEEIKNKECLKPARQYSAQRTFLLKKQNHNTICGHTSKSKDLPFQYALPGYRTRQKT